MHNERFDDLGHDLIEVPFIWIPDGYDGPRPGYPWFEAGRMTLIAEQLAAWPASTDLSWHSGGGFQQANEEADRPPPDLPEGRGERLGDPDRAGETGSGSGVSEAGASDRAPRDFDWSSGAINSAIEALRGPSTPAAASAPFQYHPIQGDLDTRPQGAARREPTIPLGSIGQIGEARPEIANPDHQPAPPPDTAANAGALVPVVLDSGLVVKNPRTGGPLLQPAGVYLAWNEEIGKLLGWLPHPDREAAMLALFLPGGFMDYQRTYGTDGRINKTLIDFGNYNYGAVAAAAGYTKTEALIAAGAANLLGSGDKSGPYFNNPRNLQFIIGGYDTYVSGLVKPRF